MKIGFLSPINPFDIGSWSGTLCHITQTLSKAHRLEWIGQDVVSAFYTFQSSKKGLYPEKYAPLFGKIISEKVNASDYDILIVRNYYLGAFLNINIPIFYVGDTTFHLFKDYLRVPSGEYEAAADNVERMMIKTADNVIFSSEWARNDAIDYYRADSSKIHVVEFGANIPHPAEYQAEIATDVCNLVFIGRNWEKKGGDKVLGAYKKLKSEGFPCTCTLIGSVPPDASEIDDPNLTMIPFLDKSKPEDLERLCNILKAAHFLVLPTEFDAFGIVFCEASAYGVPSIAANVGGVSQPVREGKNGFLLPPDATAEDYAEKIKAVFSDKKNYLKLRQSSRREYETRLNWDVWGEKVNQIFEETVKKQPSNLYIVLYQ